MDARVLSAWIVSLEGVAGGLIFTQSQGGEGGVGAVGTWPSALACERKASPSVTAVRAREPGCVRRHWMLFGFAGCEVLEP